MGMRYPAGMPNERELAAQAREHLETFDDRHAAAFLRGDRRARAMNGSPLGRYEYRLICGHVLTIHGTPLPLTTRTQFCGDEACRVHRDVVEWLNRPDRFRMGQA